MTISHYGTGGILRPALEVMLRSGTAAVALLLVSTVCARGEAVKQVAQIQQGGIIREVRIDGAERIEPETVRSYLTVQPGDAFDNGKLDKSLKALFGTMR
jgi:outer membrane protein insertion porin family